MKRHVYVSAREGDCGLDCLRMLLSDLYDDKDYVYLKSYAKGPLSLEQLIELAATQGLTLEAYAASRKEELREEKSLPVLLVLNVEGGGTHMVIYDGAIGPFAKIRDPLEGSRLVLMSKLLESWNGQFLHPSNSDPRPFAGPIPEQLPRLGRGLCLATSILAEALLLLAFFFLGDDRGILLPVTCLCLFALFEVFSRLYAVKVLRKFDEDHLSALADKDEDAISAYRDYSAFKGRYHAFPIRLFTSFLTGISLMVLFTLNDPSFFVPISVLILFLAIDAFFLQGFLRRKNLALEREERNLRIPGGAKKETFLSLFQNGERLGNVLTYRKIFMIFLEAVLALLSTLLGPSLSLNYFLFCFFSFHCLSLTLGAFLEGLSAYPFYKGAEIAFRRDFL